MYLPVLNNTVREGALWGPGNENIKVWMTGMAHAPRRITSSKNASVSLAFAGSTFIPAAPFLEPALGMRVQKNVVQRTHTNVEQFGCN